jgi:hypothetical protein
MGMDYWIGAAMTGVDPAKCLDHLAQSSRFSMALKSGDICIGTGDDGDWDWVESAQQAREMLLQSFQSFGYCGFHVIEKDTDRSITLNLCIGGIGAWSRAVCPEPEFRAWLADVLSAVGLAGLEFELDCF